MVMECPKCHADMEQITVDAYTVDRCTSCEGIWFDLREHEHLRKIDGGERIDAGDPKWGREYNTVREIRCPRCSAALVKLAFHEQPHIDHEQCSVCGGVFLDAGEFTDFVHLTLAERLRQIVNVPRK